MPKPASKSLFSQRLKEARILRGLSQEQLGINARIPVDVASARMNRYEKGVHAPDEETAKRLAAALGVPLASLYADTSTMARLIVAIGRLSEDEQRALLETLGDPEDG